MSLAVLFHSLCAQHVSGINISIIRSLRLFCWITILVVCSCFSLQHGYHANPTTPKHQHTSNQEHTTNVVIQQHSRKLLMMVILMSETCWAHKKWNKIASDIKLVYSVFIYLSQNKQDLCSYTFKYNPMNSAIFLWGTNQELNVHI